MAKVLIIGAGASHGHGIDNNSKPPLANGFFDKMYHPLVTKYSDLFNYINRALNLDINNLLTIDIEQIFERIESSWILSDYDFKTKKSKFGTAIAYHNPIDMLQSYIVDIIYCSTKWLRKIDCPFHSNIVKKWLIPGDTIISFNYDLIIDISLKKSGLWDEQDGYALNDDKSNKKKSSYFLLKPHGSLNWFLEEKYSLDNKDILINYYFKDEQSKKQDFKSEKIIKVSSLSKALHGYGYSPRLQKEDFIANINNDIMATIKKTANLYDSEEEPIHDPFWRTIWEAYESPFLTTAGLLPFLIFPTPYKNLRNMTKYGLKNVWNQIKKQLIICDEVHAIGFSFRDSHFNQLIREISIERKNPLIINFWSKNSNEFLMISNLLTSKMIKIEHMNGWLEEFVRTQC